MCSRARSIILTFDELVAKVVDDVLNSILTERCAHFVWIYLATTASVEPLDIARKPEDFSVGLRNLFGSAAQILEKLILKNLCKILGIKLEWREDCKFSDYISELREVYTKLLALRYKPFIEG